MQVLVRDNNLDQALRVLKKKMQREGLIAVPRNKRLDDRKRRAPPRMPAPSIERAMSTPTET